MRQTAGQASGSATGQQMTRQEMDALVFQRAELKDQLANITKRRNQLVEQMAVMPATQRRDHELRIKEIDARSSDIDRQMMKLDVEIANAMSKPLIDVGAPIADAVRNAVLAVPPPPPAIDRDAERAMILGSLALTAVAVYAIYLAARRFFMKPRATSIEGQARRLDQLQQSVDVIALEVERMSESQRFVAKVLNEKFPALGIGAAAPVAAKEKDSAKV